MSWPDATAEIGAKLAAIAALCLRLSALNARPRGIKATDIGWGQFLSHRRVETFNTWTHNTPALMALADGNWASLNPEDAARLGVLDGAMVRVRSANGAIDIRARLCADIRPGVVAIHQFWGHVYDSGMRTSRATPGVNVNHLHSDHVRDRSCGRRVFNGTPCRVESVT